VSSVESHKANFLYIGISYESDLNKAMKIMEEEIIAHPNFLDIRSKEEQEQKQVPAVIIRLIDFAESSMQLRATVYSKNNAEGFAMLSDLRISIKKRFDKENIEIPYPHCTITYKS
ncbi:MAG: mechanosensitive ion channel, partial [Erysipelotrichaceae bacterium]|nr:mechanosensitive ion channel [Erysipelotrichaceae bacterium]